jgi:hypothetical protein
MSERCQGTPDFDGRQRRVHAIKRLVGLMPPVDWNSEYRSLPEPHQLCLSPRGRR